MRFKNENVQLGVVIFFSLVLFCLLAACSSSPPSKSGAVISQPSQSSESGEALKKLADFDPADKTPQQLATYVFENHGCKTCHTMGENGRLGFTERGKRVGKGFEGCISLLTSMNVIAQEKEIDRSKDEKAKAAHFMEFGCTTCHQVTPGKMGLTEYGKKLASMHLACTDVEKVLASTKQ